MKQTEKKEEREVYIAPVVSDIAPVTVTRGQTDSQIDETGDNGGIDY